MMTIKKIVKRSLKIIKKAMNHILLTASLFLSIYSIFKILLSVLRFFFYHQSHIKEKELFDLTKQAQEAILIIQIKKYSKPPIWLNLFST